MKKLLTLAAVLLITNFGIAQTTYTLSYLAVAGGGGGGGELTGEGGGGGGGGGVLTGTTSISLGTYTITVGAGGAGYINDNGAVGGNTYINGTGVSVECYGGGGGGANAHNGLAGGSGGGAGTENGALSGGAGTSGQGNAGGSQLAGQLNVAGAGGGGAGAAGGLTSISSGVYYGNGGAGGAGISSSISGSLVYYGGGGGGGAYTYSTYAGVGGAGGIGGGGTGGTGSNAGTNGTANTGGGGGGNDGIDGAAGSGGSGVVILSFPTGSVGYTTTGVVSISGENTIITFNSSGTFTVLAPVVTVSPATATVCAGNHVVLTASGVSTYSWSPSSGLSSTSGISVIATPTATTTYTVSGTNSYGTVSSATVTVNVNATPAITISPALPVVAGGQSATITASGASTYTWSPSTNLNTTSGATVTANPQIATAYTLTGTSSAGCVNQLAFSVGIELFQQTADSANAPIYYNGKLGIGNNNPQAALDVTGNTKVSGLLTSNTIKVSSFSGLSSGAFVTVDSLGNLKVNPNNNNPVTLCGTTTPWMIGGNTIGNSGAVLGTCDAKDLILKANATNFLWLKSNGKVGIGTNSPSAQLDVSAYGTYAGLNIGNSSGSWFNVANNGKIGIGNTSPAAQLDIYAPGSNTGVTISNDNGPVFNIANDGSTSTNGSLTVSNGALIYGNVTIPSIINTATGVIYSSVLVDNTGKLVSGPAASATGAAWILSGNTGTYASGISQAMGALDNQADLPLLAGGTEKLRIWSNGGLNLSNTGVIQCGGTSPITSISDMGLYSQRSGYDMRFVTNNGNFNFYTNIADGTNPLGTPAVSISSTGQTIINASAGGDALILNDVSSNSSSPGNNFKVKSNGVVCAREVIVRAIGNSFPDYVFTKGYKLMPLSEVSSFIEKNHRLPNMPSAAEIEKDGASLGEIQRVSVEKIEELTLYMIELKQEIEKLKQENKDLKAIINKN